MENTNKIIKNQLKENFFLECEKAKEEQAGRESGYSIITLEKDGTIGRYLFENKNSKHISPDYIILTTINCWDVWDNELFSSISPNGEEKSGYVWDNNSNEWVEEYEAEKYIIDEACGRYTDRDLIFSENFEEAILNLNK